MKGNGGKGTASTSRCTISLHNYYSNMKVSNMEAFLKISKVLGAEKFFSQYGDMDRPSLMFKRFFLRDIAK